MKLISMHEHGAMWAVIIAAMAAAAGLWALSVRYRPGPARPDLRALPPMSASDRIMVLAPHEDDEALAAGGLIQQARAAGAQIRVAYLTNGDHNQLAFIIYRKRPWISPSINRNMGEIRRGEAIRAMASLGVSQEHLFFLGYPDNDTLGIWKKHWGTSPPLYSLLTNTTKVPYPNTIGYRMPYKGESILADLESVILKYRPTKVFVSHPMDGNPDHRAYYLYLRVALLELAGRFPAPEVFTYPVHMGPWPRPHWFHPGGWLSFPARIDCEAPRARNLLLTPGQVRRKYEAICLYRSQMADSDYWLTAFARRNELFIRDEPLPLTSGSEWSARRDGISSAETRAYEVADPVDQLGGVACRNAPEGMVVRVDLRRRIEEAMGLSVYLFGYREGTPFRGMPKLRIDYILGRLRVYDGETPLSASGVAVKRENTSLVFTIPWSALGNPAYVFMEAHGLVGGISRSYSGWQLFALDRAELPAGRV